MSECMWKGAGDRYVGGGGENLTVKPSSGVWTMVGRVVEDGKGERRALWMGIAPITAVTDLYLKEIRKKKSQSILLSEVVKRMGGGR